MRVPLDNAYLDPSEKPPRSIGWLFLFRTCERSLGAAAGPPMIAGALLLALQTVTIILLGLLLVLSPATGIGGLLAVIGFTVLFAILFSFALYGLRPRTRHR